MRALPLAAAGLVLLAVGLGLGPLLGAGWHSDDWGWLALAVHGGSPWSGYLENHGLGYYYRPAAVAFWWLATALGGLSPLPHYAQVLVLHAAAAGAVGVLTARVAGDRGRGLAAALLFALAPPVAGTVMWLSSRNEALVLAAGFAALAVLARHAPGGRRLALAALLLWVAATARETGFAFLPAAALLLCRDGGWRALIRPGVLAALLAPLVLALLPRWLIVIPIGEESDPTRLPAIMALGLRGWVAAWPQALGGWGDAGADVAARATLALGLGAVGAWRLGREGRGIALAALFALVALAAAAQSPVVSLVLPQPGAEQFVVNLRFFALATAALCVLVACAMPADALPRRRVVEALALLALLIAWGLQTHQRAAAWAADTQVQQQAMQAAVAALPRGSGCPAGLAADVLPTGLAGFADAAYKAMLPAGDARLACVLAVGGQPPHLAVLPRTDCALPPPRPGWQVPEVAGRRLAVPFGAVCQVAYRPQATGDAP